MSSLDHPDTLCCPSPLTSLVVFPVCFDFLFFLEFVIQPLTLGMEEDYKRTRASATVALGKCHLLMQI